MGRSWYEVDVEDVIRDGERDEVCHGWEDFEVRVWDAWERGCRDGADRIRQGSLEEAVNGVRGWFPIQENVVYMAHGR